MIIKKKLTIQKIPLPPPANPSRGVFVPQVKIWFQNRRAKERKQVKKREEMIHKEKMEVAVQMQQHQQQLAGGAVVMWHPPPTSAAPEDKWALLEWPSPALEGASQWWWH